MTTSTRRRAAVRIRELESFANALVAVHNWCDALEMANDTVTDASLRKVLALALDQAEDLVTYFRSCGVAANIIHTTCERHKKESSREQATNSDA